MKSAWDQGFEGVRQRQLVAGLELTPADRLKWLYQMIQLFLKVEKAKNKGSSP